MKQVQSHIRLASRQPLELIDISSEVRRFSAECGAESGILFVASQHTTLGVILNERCEALQKDMLDFLQKVAPPEAEYRHNRVAVDGRPNAHSHLLSMLIPSQLSLVIGGGELNLGQWQSVFAVELDGPRPERTITLTLMGS